MKENIPAKRIAKSIRWHVLNTTGATTGGGIVTSFELKVPQDMKRIIGFFPTASIQGLTAHSFILGDLLLHINNRQSSYQAQVRSKSPANFRRKYQPEILREELLPGSIIEAEFRDISGIAGGTTYTVKVLIKAEHENELPL